MKIDCPISKILATWQFIVGILSAQCEVVEDFSRIFHEFSGGIERERDRKERISEKIDKNRSGNGELPFQLQGKSVQDAIYVIKTTG